MTLRPRSTQTKICQGAPKQAREEYGHVNLRSTEPDMPRPSPKFRAECAPQLHHRRSHVQLTLKHAKKPGTQRARQNPDFTVAGTEPPQGPDFTVAGPVLSVLPGFTVAGAMPNKHPDFIVAGA